MAKRPSVQDILAAARAGGPVQPPVSPLSQSEREAGPPDQPAAELADLSSAPPPVASVPAPTAAALGRPLTLKEKLAAARAGGTPAPPAATAPSAPPAAPIADVPIPAPRAVPPPAAPTGRPLTMQEKLAAARAGGATPAAVAAKPAAGAAKPAVAKAAPAAARTLPPLGEIADPLDMAEALRRAGTEHEQAAKSAAATAAAEQAGATPARAAAAGKAAAAKAPAAPKVVPPRPERAGGAPAATAVATPSRRRFFPVAVSWVAAGWATFAAGTAAFSWMCLRFMFPNVLAEPPSTIKVGAPANFEKGEVNERWKAEWGFWIVRAVVDGQDELYALQSICTHLGCPPNWLAGEQKFKCPCHGSGFYITGVNFEGPAPRPLERFKISLADDGQILIDKSQKFQFELGQWSDPDSFIPV